MRKQRSSWWLAVLCCACSGEEPQAPPDTRPQPAAPREDLVALEAQWQRARGEMKAYAEEVPGTDVVFDMVPIPGGKFVMGSSEREAGRRDDEGPQRDVLVAPFWLGKCEVRWDEYDQWSQSLERERRPGGKEPKSDADRKADGVTRPTPAYTDMTFGMGREGYPAICMTHLAAVTYCEWLSAKTGKEYRLPTEAEWEYACRAGTQTAYSFGDDQKLLDDHAWHAGNAGGAYQRVGSKKPNAWGLHDMHGNVAEWVQDQWARYTRVAPGATPALNPFVPGNQEYPRIVRGGSWQDAPEKLRSAARRASDRSWKQRDPQLPQSRWYFTDAQFAGFRVARTWK
jgi:formylglycine-generating enzyme required for sulfatase activity